ncbi:NAD(P)-dependent oxidoreductase [Streptomyces sp. NPDC051104]|uniref:NAD(P)-dependent oxidoreductase n=1 Tax=Streptomyces sp. NPDC051104 TaxID=3155044 RepID=UPI003446D639
MDELQRSVVLVTPDLVGDVVEALTEVTGRPVKGYAGVSFGSGEDHLAAETPVVYVGPDVPESLRLERLSWFHSTNAGVDALLRRRSWPPEVLLTRTVGRMGERIGQYVLAWILAECQTVPVFLEQHRRTEWQRVPSELVAGQTALIYGAGRVGARVAAMLSGCGIHTVGVSRTARTAVPGFDETVTTDAADALLGGARWVVSTLPLTAETENFFDADRFDAMRGATFINAGRGANVDLAALAHAIDTGAVRTAVLDVLREEPPGFDHLVWRLPRTVVTSHSAGITGPDDVTADFAVCWEALSQGRLPELAVVPAQGY